MQDRASLYNYANGEAYEGLTVEETFHKIFEETSWNVQTEESVSGEGSTLEQTRELINELPEVLRNLGVQTILDAPCGDFNWMKFVDLTDIKYTGADIVPSIIQNNKDSYGSLNRDFVVLDLINDDLPKVDVIFSRDCLVHFSFEMIKDAIQNIKKSGSKYLMTTHFSDQDSNKDILTGGWRPLNLCLEPFNFPVPKLMIDEKCTEMNGAFSDKMIAVWEIKDLP